MPATDRNERPSLLKRALLVLLLIGGLAYSVNKEPAEVHVYTTAAERLMAGEEIYRPTETKPFTYPPFFAVLFVPLTGLGTGWTKALFFVLNATLLACTIRWLDRGLRRAFDWSEAPSRGVLWFGALLLSARPLLSVFQNQSHDLVVMAAIAFAIERTTRRPAPIASWGAGAGFAFGAACKATPLAFLPMLAWSGRLLASSAFVLFATLVTLLPDLLWPRADDRLHISAWIETYVSNQDAGRPAEQSGIWAANSPLNQNLAGTVFRLSREVPDELRSTRTRDASLWTPDDDTLRNLTLLAQALVVLSIAWITRPRTPRRLENIDPYEFAFRAFGRASAVCCGLLLLSPMSSKYHFGLLLVPSLFAVATWIHHGPPRGLLTALGTLFVLGTLTTKGLLGRSFGYAVLAYGSLCWATVAALCATGFAMRRARTAEELEASALEQ